jgi:hypothetical protein
LCSDHSDWSLVEIYATASAQSEALAGFDEMLVGAGGLRLPPHHPGESAIR